MTPNGIIVITEIILLLFCGLYAATEAVCRYMVRKTDEQIAESERKHATDERNIDYDIEYYFG